MTGKERREKMDLAIKEIIIPFLRDKGFKGSYPHFRRDQRDNLNLLTFQFSMSGPMFVVEIANCPAKGFNPGYGNDLKPSECRTYYMQKRLRVGSLKDRKHSWYEFGKETFFGNIYHKKAKEVLGNWAEAEKWWNDNPVV